MIQENKVLSKLRKDLPALGGWVMTSAVTPAEIMSQAGFDWVCVDAEHSPVSKETASNMFRAIERHGAEPFVRISLNDEVEIKKFLDIGARGIIVPMIKSYEEVEEAVSCIKYPPEGKRSFALPRCTGFGQWPDEYFAMANKETFIGIMIEHIDAVKEIDRIFSSKAIDAILAGPYDLSGSLGIPGQFDNREFKETLDLISRKAKEHSVRTGMHEVHPTKEKINKLIDGGYRFIACGIDTLFLLEKAQEFASLTVDLHEKITCNS